MRYPTDPSRFVNPTSSGRSARSTVHYRPPPVAQRPMITDDTAVGSPPPRVPFAAVRAPLPRPPRHPPYDPPPASGPGEGRSGVRNPDPRGQKGELAKNRQFFAPYGAESRGSGGAPPTNLILLRNQCRDALVRRAASGRPSSARDRLSSAVCSASSSSVSSVVVVLAVVVGGSLAAGLGLRPRAELWHGRPRARDGDAAETRRSATLTLQ